MADPNRFLEKTKRILERRAASKCSNPYCKITTSAAHTEVSKSINLGEAAHIFGANPGSARFDAEMQETDRADILNGIWLCRTCAKTIDSDEKKYTPETLFEWKNNHEKDVLRNTKTSEWEREYLFELYQPIKEISSRGLQLAVDKPELWDYKLVVELLGVITRKTRRSLDYIHEGLCYSPSRYIKKDYFNVWHVQKSRDIMNIITMMSKLLELRMSPLFDSDENKDPMDIYYCIERINIACGAIIKWEEDLYVSIFPSGMEKVHELMRGWTEDMYEQILRLKDETQKIIDTVYTRDSNVKNEFKISLTFSAPENFAEVDKEISRCLALST